MDIMLKMMDFILKLMNFILNAMEFILTMMDLMLNRWFARVLMNAPAQGTIPYASSSPQFLCSASVHSAFHRKKLKKNLRFTPGDGVCILTMGWRAQVVLQPGAANRGASGKPKSLAVFAEIDAKRTTWNLPLGFVTRRWGYRARCTLPSTSNDDLVLRINPRISG